LGIWATCDDPIIGRPLLLLLVYLKPLRKLCGKILKSIFLIWKKLCDGKSSRPDYAGELLWGKAMYDRMEPPLEGKMRKTKPEDYKPQPFAWFIIGVVVVVLVLRILGYF
jgi:hypothetical protein